jgi:hypothetical protein
MQYTLLSIALVAEAVVAFPFVSEMPGVDSSLFRRQQPGGNQPGGAATCPFNANHVPAPGIKAPYLYNNAKNGLPGNGKGGYQVPAPGDNAHKFVAPGPNDIRGPCPGLNAAANHNFLAHDGITTFNELMDAQQNLYNVGYDVALLLAVLGLTLTDGDLVTEKLSIGCDATTRTSFSSLLTGSEPGLDGHNKFESDTSLTRNDYFLGGGDNFSFNGTLFKMMTDTTGGNYNRDGMAKYRYQRYQQSLKDNPNFYFGPLTLLIYGASSFLYELMPNGNRGYQPDEETISSFFGAQKNSDGSYSFNNQEKIPDNWTNRVAPYNSVDVAVEVLAQYLEYPVLFGSATGNGGFDVINFGSSIKDGKLISPPDAKTAACFLYELATQSIPSYANGILTPTVEAIAFVVKKLGPTLTNLGCPIPLT